MSSEEKFEGLSRFVPRRNAGSLRGMRRRSRRRRRGSAQTSLRRDGAKYLMGRRKALAGSVILRRRSGWIDSSAVCISGNDLYFPVLVARNRIEEDMWGKIRLLKVLIFAEHGMS